MKDSGITAVRQERWKRSYASWTLLIQTVLTILKAGYNIGKQAFMSFLRACYKQRLKPYNANPMYIRSKNTLTSCLSMVCIVFSLFSCGSLKEQSMYKNPNTVLFHADKVLVVGMVSDYGTRMRFESRLKDALTERGVETMRSIDLFDVDFTASERSEAELDKVERQLLDKDFDAILFSKRIDVETRSELSAQLAEMGRSYERFQEDYLIHQGIYYDPEASENSRQYTAETSLYCLCDGKQRELIWRSDVRLPKKRNTDRVFDSYADWLVENLEVQQLIIGHKPF